LFHQKQRVGQARLKTGTTVMNIKNEWFIDKDSRYRWIYHSLKKRILSVRTRFQHVEIFDTHEFGRVVVLDEKIQSAEMDEYIYHEALVHPAMVTHPKPEKILIFGAGEGATLREVLKHPTVLKATMIDIDEEFVDLCKKHLKKWHRGSFNDSRVEVIYTEAVEYLKKKRYRFDIIIADISDPVEDGPAVSIYTREFYSLIKGALLPDGIFVTHATSVPYIPQKNISGRIFKTLAGIFKKADFYYEYIPSFGTLWAYTTGSMKYSLKKTAFSLIQRRLKERRLEDLLFYDAETHDRMFCLPKNVRRSQVPIKS